MYYVYVLQNKRQEVYIGYTNDLKRRYREHNTAKEGYTKHQEWEIVYYEAYKNKKDAIEREKKLKQHGQAKRWLKERIKRSLSE